MVIAGLMSGSSLDGLDLAICNFVIEDNHLDWTLISHATIPFSELIFDQLSKITELSAKELVKLDHEFAEFCARAVSDYTSANNIELDYIASHGHTVYHEPQDRYTLQIGNGGVIAALSGVPTICDFRVNDVALGGQGAPIVPIVEKYLFPDIKYFLNLGGIANISIHAESIIAYDICPCNQILNNLAQKRGKTYDDGGAMAAQGEIHQGLLDSLHALDYFKASPPKSLDNSWVQSKFYNLFDQFELTPEDGLATMTSFIAQTIGHEVGANGVATEEMTELMITGGGAYNSFLIKRISDQLPNHIKIKSTDPALIEAKEAILMALMGYLRVEEKANTLTSVTGASGETCGGAIYVPYGN